MAERFNKARVEALISLLSPQRLTRIVDVGASPLTPTPYGALKEIGGCEVWGFEPNPDQFRRLVKAAGPREHYLPYALGDGRPAQLHVTRNPGFTSLLRPNPATAQALGRFVRATEVTASDAIDTRRLDDIDELPAFDLLKIDIQGGELAVFENGPRLMSSALAVITEVAAAPIYRDQPLLDDQMRALRELGFDLHKFLFFKTLRVNSPRTARFKNRAFHANQLIDGDAVFVRGVFDLSGHSDEALKHIAILADAVFESFDLAAVALGELADRGRISQAGFDAYVDRVPGTRPAGDAPGVPGVHEVPAETAETAV